jgi:uncharacterized protein (TIGR00369 family)
MTTLHTPTDIPEGFVRHPKRSPLTDPWEPIYSKEVTGAVIIGLRLAEAHTNSRGLIHGGLIAALADNAMGMSCAANLTEPPHGLVTVSLSVDYLGSANIGQWLQVETNFVKTG